MLFGDYDSVHADVNLRGSPETPARIKARPVRAAADGGTALLVAGGIAPFAALPLRPGRQVLEPAIPARPVGIDGARSDRRGCSRRARPSQSGRLPPPR